MPKAGAGAAGDGAAGDGADCAGADCASGQVAAEALASVTGAARAAVPGCRSIRQPLKRCRTRSLVHAQERSTDPKGTAATRAEQQAMAVGAEMEVVGATEAAADAVVVVAQETAEEMALEECLGAVTRAA